MWIGGLMSYCKAKTRFIAEESIVNLIRKNPGGVYFYTFTEPGRQAGESYWTKTEAEEHLKPFLDLLRRRGASFLVFWELQRRGAWHPHVLLNRRFDARWLRAWMMERGWGVQMELRQVRCGGEGCDGTNPINISVQRLVRYLVKYLTKASTNDSIEPRKKFFGGSSNAKVGTVQFRWAPWINPTAMLWNEGKAVYCQLWGIPPVSKWLALSPLFIRMGVEVVDWLSVDPWWLPTG